MIQVLLVPTDDAPRFLPLVRDWIRSSARHSYGRYRPEDVEGLLVSGVFLLWLVWNAESGEIKGMIVTSQGVYPRLRALRVDFLAGVDFAEWREIAQQTLERFAQEVGCTRLETVARRGWARKLPGWTQPFTFLERAV